MSCLPSHSASWEIRAQAPGLWFSDLTPRPYTHAVLVGHGHGGGIPAQVRGGGHVGQGGRVRAHLLQTQNDGSRNVIGPPVRTTSPTHQTAWALHPRPSHQSISVADMFGPNWIRPMNEK